MIRCVLFILIIFPNLSYGQGSKNNSDLEDSIAFKKAKKVCNIIEYRDKNSNLYFKTQGEFIKAYTLTSYDKMLSYSVAVSSLDTIWTLDLKAYGNIWTDNPVGLQAIGGIGESSISMPDIPIKVEYDKQKKIYLYSAHLVSRKPFNSLVDQTIASNIYYILTCSVYKLYVFEHINKNPDLMTDCLMKINNQLLSNDERNLLKKQRKDWDDEFAPLIKQTQKGLDKKNKK